MNSLVASTRHNLSSSNKTANVGDIPVKDINLNEVKLSKYKGKVLLIVNVASKCGFTSQYEGLQKIYELYKDRLSRAPFGAGKRFVNIYFLKNCCQKNSFFHKYVRKINYSYIFYEKNIFFSQFFMK